MLDAVTDALTGVLTDGGINGARCFADSVFFPGQTVVCVGINSCRSLSPGLGDYLGYRTNGDGSQTELYGKRLELEAAFEVMSPFGERFGEADCVSTADAVTKLLASLPAGMRTVEISRGEISADETLGVFRCRILLVCTAFFIAESEGDGEEFLDFILKGSVGNAD